MAIFRVYGEKHIPNIAAVWSLETRGREAWGRTGLDEPLQTAFPAGKVPVPVSGHGLERADENLVRGETKER